MKTGAAILASLLFAVGLEAGELIIPVKGVRAESLKSDFHQPRSKNRKHRAIDIRAKRGTPVLAAADGSIRKLFRSGAGGVTIYQVDERGETIYYYAHLDRYAKGVREGMSVCQGDVIGYVGTTGNAPENVPHLHFAVMVDATPSRWWRGTPVDPYPLLVQQGDGAIASGQP